MKLYGINGVISLQQKLVKSFHAFMLLIDMILYHITATDAAG